MVKVKLEDVIEQIEFASESSKSFLNLNTGEIHVIPEEVEIYAEEDIEDEDFIPDWEKEIIPVAKDIQKNPDNYIRFPDQYDIHEYSIMESFSLSLSDEKLRDILYYSLKGSGAFRRFKENINRLGITEEWYKYKDEALRKIAVEWCQDNNLEYY
ncbi:hypothetical protein BMS3Abin03_00889 [bacterium BMS3Abin03]|nr:hypothetical protein BMS3Abin03_00889 [bacterium BMS3Abin03]